MRFAALTLTALTLALAGCDRGREAGAFLDQGDFGSATLNNELAQTCRRAAPASPGKYGTPLGAACPGRTEDGKYAMFAYKETIESATEQISSAVADIDLAIGD